ncbi:hypothetical protein [Micromonospora palythoicola]|uniref:hypothetical protein n=1 Tax=Micromonospora palythoicola TaxID=3120507 RepID=UPI002FCDFDAC
MTADETRAAIHRSGEKVGGLPVDNRWTTVDNRVHDGHLWIVGRVVPPLIHSEPTCGERT